MKYFIITILVLFSFNTFANMSAIRRPSQRMSSIFVIKDNNLRVLDEKIFYEIDKLTFNAKIKVVYTIKNEGSKVFNESFYFIYPNSIDKKISVKIDGINTDFQLEKNFDADKLNIYRTKKPSNKQVRYLKEEKGGFIFPITLNPSETKVIQLEYTQIPGFSKLNSNATFAAMSHYRNMMNSTSPNKTYSYYLYPIRSFSKGVDKITVQFKFPKKDENQKKISLINLNAKLKFKKEEADNYIYEGVFKESVPNDILYFELQAMAFSKIGFTIAPTAFFIESEDENTWAVFTSFDYIIKNFQVSIGVLSNFDEKLQIYQEIKFFPPGISHYLAVFFDYRYSFGLVEQISPNKSFGFRLSAGFKFILPFELTYQGFPPFTEEEWKHELFFNIPFSF